jgi:hypothetical protein
MLLAQLAAPQCPHLPATVLNTHQLPRGCMQPKHDETLSISQGATVAITTRHVAASCDVLPVTYAKLPQLVEVGDHIYVGRWARGQQAGRRGRGALHHTAGSEGGASRYIGRKPYNIACACAAI